MIRIQWLELGPEDSGVLTRPLKTLEIPDASTVTEALEAIGLAQERISKLLQQRAVAVHGLYAIASTVLHEGDRLEILDELNFEPMESRRRRAQHKVLTKRQKELARFERRSRKQSRTNT